MATTQEIIESHDQPQGLLAEGITRAYIHEGALGQWAVASSRDATEMLWFMGAVRFSRIVGNVLGPGGDIENAWKEDDANLNDAIDTLLAADERRWINPLLQHAAVSVISMDIQGDPSTGSPIVEKLVPIGESLDASCFDENYHTLGLNKDGTQEMRDDNIPMSQLTAQMATDTAPRNLAIVHGPNGTSMRGGQGIYEYNADAIVQGIKTFGDYLVPVELSIGATGTSEYIRQVRPDSPLSLNEVLNIDKIARSGIVQITNVRIGMVHDMIDKQQSRIGHKRHEDRIGQIEHLRREVARVIGRHQLIHPDFYPQGR